jgi:glyceraldehyde-3-phosphate dehydrogenase type I
MIETGVNGFGRIGALYTRVAIDAPSEVDVAAINSGRKLDVHDIWDRLDVDTVHGPFRGHEVTHDEGSVLVDGDPIKVFNAETPEACDWGRFSDKLLVIEATGQFVTAQSASRHLEAGAKKVVITAPAKEGEVTTIVRGVNDDEATLAQAGDVVSTSSCSTNCIAPVLKALGDQLDLRWASADIIHASTGSQRLLDGRGKNPVARRSAANIIPASTGSSKEIRRLFPDLSFGADSFRVANPDGSLAILTAEVKGSVSEENIIAILKEAAQTPALEGVLGIEDGDMFSGRVIGKSYSAGVDISQVLAREFNGHTVIKLQAWFDNEWGYANRVHEVAEMVGKLAL